MAKKKLMVAHQGEPLPKTNNIVLDIKFYLQRNYNLRRNLISRNIEKDGDPIDDGILNSIFINIKTNYSKATKDLVTAIIFSDFIESYNPFLELIDKYKESPPQIKTGHIDNLIKSIKTDTLNYEIFIRKWIVSLIATVNYQHSPLMLVLCGGQNTGKTEWFRRLLPKEFHKYYAESKLDAGKDDEILMTKKLIIMDDEMGGKSKLEQKKLKEMTSKQIFSIRAPYGRVSEELHRLAMLCGTTNDVEILNDPTGNRRILPVRVISIDHELFNGIDKDLLFYEAYLAFNSGESFSLTNEDIQVLKDSSEEFKQSSTEEELVTKYYGVPDESTSQKVMVDRTNSEILSYIQTHSNTKLSQTKLGLILKQMGFVQKHVKVNNTTIRTYSVIEHDLSRSYENKSETYVATGPDAPF